MIIIGVLCDKCRKDILDCGDKCVRCGHPYNEFQLKMVKEHQAAKMALVERTKNKNLGEEEMLREINALGKVTTELGSISDRFGGDCMPAEIIERKFTEFQESKAYIPDPWASEEKENEKMPPWVWLLITLAVVAMLVFA